MKKFSIQYTIRHVPPRIDQTLRQKSRETGSSLNQAALAALTKGLGLADEPVRSHDLDSLAGSWKEDAEFESAIAEQDKVDPNLWKRSWLSFARDSHYDHIPQLARV